MLQETPVKANPYWEALSPEDLEVYDRAMIIAHRLAVSGAKLDRIPKDSIFWSSHLWVALAKSGRADDMAKLNEIFPDFGYGHPDTHDDAVRRPAEGYQGEPASDVENCHPYPYPDEKERGMTIATFCHTTDTTNFISGIKEVPGIPTK